MERNPYAPPKAEVSDADPEGRAVPGELYTPGQHFAASFIGSPIAAAWIAAANCRELGRREEARQIILWGTVATTVLFAVAFVVPEGFPDIVLPLAYSAAVQALAKHRFGALVDAHRAAGGKLKSWWYVIGISVLALIVVGLIFFGLAFALITLLGIE